MARRTKEEAAITREQLLDAAERIFRENGVTRTSLAEVAQAAGVTRGAVYWHFRDKADLFTAMCERATLPLDAALERAAVSGVNDPLGLLRTLAITALTRLATDARSQAVFEVIFHKSELTDELATIAERKQCGQRECLLQVERVVRQAVGAGQLPVDTDTALATQALHAFMTGIMHEWVGNKAAYDLAAAAPAFIDMMLAGLQADPPRRKGRVVRRTRKAAPIGARRRKSSRPLAH